MRFVSQIPFSKFRDIILDEFPKAAFHSSSKDSYIRAKVGTEIIAKYLVRNQIAYSKLDIFPAAENRGKPC
jgi:hypothetical protein